VRLRRSENVRLFSQQHAASTSCPLFALPWFGQSYKTFPSCDAGFSSLGFFGESQHAFPIIVPERATPVLILKQIEGVVCAAAHANR
jgi:hypothetical protein